MDRPISVGDLVVVVKRGGCVNGCAPISFGRVFKVSAIRPAHDLTVICSQCKSSRKVREMVAEGDGQRTVYLLSRLKRIPPLDEMEGVRTEETLKVPA